jgi:CSLREA domain-containing protein
MSRSRTQPLALLLLLALAACRDEPVTTGPGLHPALAQVAAGPVVNSLADPGDGTCDDAECTLREAVGSAASGATITFSVTGAITLTDEIIVDQDLTIDGPGAGLLTVQRSSAAGTPQFRFATINTGRTVVITEVTVKGFDVRNRVATPTDWLGGAVLNRGTLTVSHSVLTQNRAQAGGAIAGFGGSLTINHSTITDNAGIGAGGGISSFRGNVTINHTTVSDNSAVFDGGGIHAIEGDVAVVDHSAILNNVCGLSGCGLYLHQGQASINHTTVSHNLGGSDGGGIFVGCCSVTLTNVTVSNNRSTRGGGLRVLGQVLAMTIERSTFADNQATVSGGGIDSESSFLDLIQSRLSGNSAGKEGGGVYLNNEFHYEADFINTTISGNTAGKGGGVYAFGSNAPWLRFAHTTVTGNTASAGAAVYLDGSFTNSFLVQMRNTIVAGATNDLCLGPVHPASGPPPTGFTMSDQGHNIDSGISCNFTAVSKSSTDPLLGPLADNGGPTWTHALLPGSPALDAADCLDNVGATITVDQRGITRPQGGACDIGAVEREPSPYRFTGFFVPVDNLPTVNLVKAGTAIPIKFSLGGDFGLGILAAGSPSSQNLPCEASAGTDAIESTVNAGSSSLNYDATAMMYSYVWKTDKAWTNTCREFKLVLDDGTTKTALFRFTK